MFGCMIMLLGVHWGVDWRWKTTHVLNWQFIIFAGLQKLIQNGEYLRIKHLKSSNPIHHSLQALKKTFVRGNFNIERNLRCLWRSRPSYQLFVLWGCGNRNLALQSVFAGLTTLSSCNPPNANLHQTSLCEDHILYKKIKQNVSQLTRQYIHFRWLECNIRIAKRTTNDETRYIHLRS